MNKVQLIILGSIILSVVVCYLLINCYRYETLEDKLSISLDDVTEIKVLDGNNGNMYMIENINEVKSIIVGLEENMYKKEFSRERVTGYRYSLTLFNGLEKEVLSITLSSNRISGIEQSLLSKNSMEQLLITISEIISDTYK